MICPMQQVMKNGVKCSDRLDANFRSNGQWSQTAKNMVEMPEQPFGCPDGAKDASS